MKNERALPLLLIPVAILYNSKGNKGYLQMPAVRGREGTHAKGSCEPGQAGRCSHKQRPLVQWISLSQSPFRGRDYNSPWAKSHGLFSWSAMAKKKTTSAIKPPAPAAPAGVEYTVLAR